MTSWLSEYLAALDARDAREKAHESQVNAYTKLADRTAALESKTALLLSAAHVAQPSNAPRSRDSGSVRGQQLLAKEETGVPHSDALARLRDDLATAQKSRAELIEKQKRLNREVEQLRVKTQKDARRMEELDRERAALERRVKDRDEELKGKTRLSEDVQNEMVSLNLQLHMVEKRSEKLERENKELIDRWMTRKGEEADAMNNASKWS